MREKTSFHYMSSVSALICLLIFLPIFLCLEDLSFSLHANCMPPFFFFKLIPDSSFSFILSSLLSLSLLPVTSVSLVAWLLSFFLWLSSEPHSMFPDFGCLDSLILQGKNRTKDETETTRKTLFKKRDKALKSEKEGDTWKEGYTKKKVYTSRIKIDWRLRLKIKRGQSSVESYEKQNAIRDKILVIVSLRRLWLLTRVEQVIDEEDINHETKQDFIDALTIKYTPWLPWLKYFTDELLMFLLLSKNLLLVMNLTMIITFASISCSQRLDWQMGCAWIPAIEISVGMKQSREKNLSRWFFSSKNHEGRMNTLKKGM